MNYIMKILQSILTIVPLTYHVVKKKSLQLLNHYILKEDNMKNTQFKSKVLF